MFKNSTVVMLPTNKKAGKLSKGNKSGILEIHDFIFEKSGIYNNHDFYHLYILSDDKIEAGDWYIRLFDNTIMCANSQSDHKHYDCRKIIATTNKTLLLPQNFPSFTYLPQPSDSFTQRYIESYNNGKSIIDVLVEYEEYFSQNKGDKLTINKDLYKLSFGSTITIKSFNFKGDPDLIEFEEDDNYNQGIHISHTNLTTETLLKIDKDNTITIKNVKDSWNKEELFEELSKIAGDVRKDGFGIWSTPKSYTSNWMKENNL